MLSVIFFLLVSLVNAGVLKNYEDQPLTHLGALCGTQQCPDNQRCEMPLGGGLECDNENSCEVEPRCVNIQPSKPVCKENEELRECGSACEPTCDNQSPVCGEQCLTNVCQCNSGYARDSSGNCRKKDDCTKCLLECPTGETCEFVELSCEKEVCKTIEVCAVPTVI